MNGLAGKRRSGCAEQAGGGGIGKADFAMAVHAANAVGNRVKENLLLAVELLGAATFLGAGEHLAERGSCGLNGGHSVVVLAEPKRTSKTRGLPGRCCQRAQAQPIRRSSRYAGRTGCGAGRKGTRSVIQTARPSFHVRPGQLRTAWQSEAHALLNEGFGLTPGRSPGGGELELVLFGFDLPFDGQIPSLGDAKSLKDSHRGNFEEVLSPTIWLTTSCSARRCSRCF